MTNKHIRTVSWFLALAGLGLLALWAGRSCSAQRSGLANFNNPMHVLLTNTTEFARSRVTGGVGAVLGIDPVSGVPTIMGIKAGSPADKAGLARGDVITHVNGVTTAGQKLTDVVEAIRGFSLGSVVVTVLRGQTNQTRLEFIIRRNSMDSLLHRTNSIH